MTRDRVIGRAGALPWDIPEEYAHFLDLVRGHPIVLGRTTYEIFGRDLRESPLIVVSSTLRSLPDANVAGSVDAALARAGTLGERVFGAGGATIYRQTLPRADALFLSIVKGDFEGETRFPELDDREWVVARRHDHPRFEFLEYRRRGPGSGPEGRNC